METQTIVNPSGRAILGVGLQPLDYCHCGFESRWKHECSSLAFVVSCDKTDHLLTAVLTGVCVSVCVCVRVCVCVCVWSRKLNNEMVWAVVSQNKKEYRYLYSM